jgi:hypothetical protein
VTTLLKAGGMAQKDVDQSTSDEQTAEGAYKAARDAVRIFGKTANHSPVLPFAAFVAEASKILYDPDGSRTLSDARRRQHPPSGRLSPKPGSSIGRQRRASTWLGSTDSG